MTIKLYCWDCTVYGIDMPMIFTGAVYLDPIKESDNREYECPNCKKLILIRIFKDKSDD